MKSKSTAAHGARSYGLFVNFFILILIVIAVGSNLFVSNTVASQRFAVEVKKKELNTLGNSLAAREVELSGSAGMAQVLSFAHRNGMVPGSQSQAIFLNTGVAYIHGFAQD